MKNTLVLIFTIFMISCCNIKSVKDDISKSNKNDKLDFFQAYDLGSSGSKTRLIIYANFDECGEWGGHTEKFEIFSKRDKEFYANYTRTKVDCNKVGELYGKPEFQRPYINKEINVGYKQKIAINDYLLSLIKSKINENFVGHAGQNFGAIKTDSTLVIDVYDHDKKNLQNYNKLLNAFNLEKVEYKIE